MNFDIRTWFYVASLLLAVFRRGDGYSDNPSCANTVVYVRRHEPDLLYTYDSDVASICDLVFESCCQSKVEKRLLVRTYQNVTADIEKMLHSLTRDFRHYDTLIDAYTYTINKAKESYLYYFRNTFGIHHDTYTAGADSLFQYLSNLTSNPDTSQFPTELYNFFANLFVASSKEFLYLTNVSPGYQQCIRSVYRRFDHYSGHNTLYTSLSSALHKLGLVLRARAALEQVIAHLTREPSLLSGEDCPTSLMKMSTCQLCDGYSYGSIPPCRNLCLNTLGGCLAPLLRLTEPLLYQYRMLDQLIFRSADEFEGFGYQLNSLASTTMDFVFRMHNNSQKIVGKIKNQCALEKDSKRKRSPSNNDDWNVSDGLSNSVFVSAHRLNIGLREFILSHNRVVSFLLKLPSKLCEKIGAASRNSHCWNGKEKGKYKVKRFNTSISQQLNNPVVSHTRDSFLSYQHDYETIKDVTYSLQDFVQVKACFKDDFQCYVDLPQCSGSYMDRIGYEWGSGMSGDDSIENSGGESETGGEDASSSEEGVDESLSYSGDAEYEVKNRVNSNEFYKIARGMHHTVITCLPSQFEFSHISTPARIPPTAEPSNDFNLSDYITIDTPNSTTESAATRDNCIIFLIMGLCIYVLMIL